MKFAKVGYGTEGQGVQRKGDASGYTYLVEDTTRKGDKLTPIVRHYHSQKLFVTTGKVLSTGGGKPDESDEKTLTKAYTQRQLGIYGERGIGGKYQATEGSYHAETGDYVPSTREQKARALSIAVEAEQKNLGESAFSGKQTAKAMKTLDAITGGIK